MMTANRLFGVGRCWGIGGSTQTAQHHTVASEGQNVGVSMRHVPWHVKGVRPDAREVARDAARRSGLSVGEWLNSLIIDAGAHEGSTAGDYQEPAVPGPTHPRLTRDADARFVAIRRDIDELKWQIDRLSQGYGPRPAVPHDQSE